MKLDNASAMVTGGASGLGAATVRRLHAEGARVLICDLNGDGGRQLADELGDGVVFELTDVTSQDSVQEAVSLASGEAGGLRLLVNCAGIAIAEKIVGRDGPHDLSRYRKVIEVNLIGTFNCLRLAAASMAGNEPDESGERGLIVNTASVAAYEGQIGQAAYASSKGGIVALTITAARDLARNGVRVCTIAPGVFETPLLAGLPDKARIALEQMVPFPQRLGRPREYAATVAHIAENTILNGETIRLDGALRMPPR